MCCLSRRKISLPDITTYGLCQNSSVTINNSELPDAVTYVAIGVVDYQGNFMYVIAAYTLKCLPDDGHDFRYKNKEKVL